MTRHIILGNGNMLVCYDHNYCIRDFYYPYVGQDNHVSGNHHRIGVWVDGELSWITEEEWDLHMSYKKGSLVGETQAYNEKLKLKLKIKEAVHHEENILLRSVDVENHAEHEREIRVFFSQHFHISESNIGDTVYYDPYSKSIINYKGKVYFLIGGMSDGNFFDDYAVGNSEGSEDSHGTYLDAQDGILSKNPIEHGSVDSTIGFSLKLKNLESKNINYWITVGENQEEVESLRSFILKEGVEKLFTQVENYWESWVSRSKINFHHLSQDIKDLFERSLLILKAQTDKRGAIIAANDTHTFRQKRDTYSYMWPRDGALIARSFDRTGHKKLTSRFFKFCANSASKDGYLLHKYRPDGSVGSSWHSWLKGDKPQLPIQEDETALVLDALWKSYHKHRDEKMIKEIYKNFIKRAGDFMVDFREEKTNLPKESYDLWEEKLGVHTFTCATVYAGLIAAKNFAEIFGTKTDAKKYFKAAQEVRQATIKYLYDEDEKVFIKRIYYDEDGNVMKDKTVDASTFYGLFEYEVLNIDDPRLKRTADKAIEKLWSNTKCKGLCRYEDDKYYRLDGHPENPWFVSTMWLAEYHIAKAKTKEDLERAQDLLEWASSRALSTGVMSEQLDPLSCYPLSVAPLTWSHAGFVIATIKYLDRLKELSD